ncbi:MAG: tetratricopeptide repeat protein, partial [Terriglobia bacterium]
MRTRTGIFVFANSIIIVAMGCATTEYWQGNQRLKQGDYQGAVEALTKAIDKDPMNFGAYLNRGVAYRNLREPDKALQDYSRAIEIVPSFGMAYLYRGQVYADMGQYERAVEQYDLALKYADAVQIDAQGQLVTINKPAVYYDRGNSLYELGRYRQAIESYDGALTLSPRFAPAYNNRGVAYSKLQDKQAACRDRSKACDLNYSPSCKWVKEN